MNGKGRRHWLPFAATLGLLAPVAQAQDVETSFEFTDLTGLFSLGTGPFTTTFTNGFAQTVLNFSLYRTGMNAWMVSGGNTGTITLDTPAETIDLWFKEQFATVNGQLRVFDTTNAVVGTFDATQVFQRVNVTAPVGGPYLARIELTHNGATDWVVIDDFTYFGVGGLGGSTPVDDPIGPRIHERRLAVGFETVASGLAAPNFGVADPVGLNRLFVSDQAGVLYAIDLGTNALSVFHDLSSRLVPLGIFGPDTFDERGFLGFAFHPDYATNGLLYTYTSEPLSGTADFSTIPMGSTANHQTVITEWAVNNPMVSTSVVDPASARILLRIDQPQFNHNAGCLGFGPDGLLYISLGDGGGADDGDGQDFIGAPIIGHGATGNGQNTETVLGSILRIDPLGSNSANGSYGNPGTNPFVGMAGLDEIFAHGFRNPWRFSFDSMTGSLVVADVGQNDIEEIHIVALGDNCGWNLKEGSFFFDPNGLDSGYVSTEDPGVPAGLVDPVAEYDHDEGIAVVGGFVYRGSAHSLLDGAYVFGDWSRSFQGNNGRLLYFRPGSDIREFQVPGGSLGLSLHGFGQDANGELYVIGNQTGTPFGTTGVVMRISSAFKAAPIQRASTPTGAVTRDF